MRYQALLTTQSPVPLGRRCALLGVSRSGYYAWHRRRASARAQCNRLLVAETQPIHAELDRTYGSPRMHPQLVARGFPCGRHRVARLMRAHGDPGEAGPPVPRHHRQRAPLPGRPESPRPPVHRGGPQPGVDGGRCLRADGGGLVLPGGAAGCPFSPAAARLDAGLLQPRDVRAPARCLTLSTKTGQDHSLESRCRMEASIAGLR